MTFLEDRFNAHLSSLFKTKHPDFIPQISSLIPKVTTSPQIWSFLSKEILTPFAPKFKLYNFEKYLPQFRHKKTFFPFNKKPSIDSPSNESIRSISEDFSVDTCKDIKGLKSPKIITRGSFHQESSVFKLKSCKLLQRKLGKPSLINENLIFKKSHSFNFEQAVDLFLEPPEKKPINSKSKLDKLRSFAFSKNKPSQQVSKDSNFSLSKLLKKPKPDFRYIFRRKSCTCKSCGSSGKLDKIHTIPQKILIKPKEKEPEKAILLPPNISSKQTSYSTIQKHNSLKLDEMEKSFKDLKNLEIMKKPRISCINMKIESLDKLEKNSLSKKNSNNSREILNLPKKSFKFIDKKSVFAMKNYGIFTDRIRKTTPLLNNTVSKEKPNFTMNYSGHYEAMSDRTYWTNEEKSLELSEILYMNGSFRTKEFFKKQIENLQTKIKPEIRVRSPYLVNFISRNVSGKKTSYLEEFNIKK